MLSDLKLARVADGDVLRWFARLATVRLNLLHNVHAFNDGTKHDVTVVQPSCLHGCDEELGSICVRTSVGHRHDAGSSVLQGEVFILEFISIDGLASSAVVVGEVTALAHEVRDDAMESRALESVALLAGAQSTEVFACLRSNIGAKLKRDNFLIK